MFSCNARESCDHSKAQADDADLSKRICPSLVHSEAELPHHSRSKRVSEETASRICGWWLVTAAGGANRACCRRGQYPQLKLPFNFLAKQSIVRDPALGTVVRLPKPLHALHCNLILGLPGAAACKRSRARGGGNGSRSGRGGTGGHVGGWVFHNTRSKRPATIFGGGSMRSNGRGGRGGGPRYRLQHVGGGGGALVTRKRKSGAC